MRGIVLLALGEYYKWAFQMAMSVKYHSDIPIQLLHDGCYNQFNDWQKKFFDYEEEMEETDCYLDGKIFPALAKLSLNTYTIFEETIYLDVDGVCVRPIDEIFDHCKDYYASQIFGYGEEGEEEYDKMYWAYPKDLWEHFTIPKGSKIPFINSSFQYLTKTVDCDKLFKKAKDLILDEPFPVNKLRYAFGKGTHPSKQPDELYMDVALAQLGIDPAIEVEPFYFSNRPLDTEEYIRKNHWVIGLYGKRGDHTHTSVMTYYDRMIHKMLKKKHNTGIVYKSAQLMRNKFIDIK